MVLPERAVAYCRRRRRRRLLPLSPPPRTTTNNNMDENAEGSKEPEMIYDDICEKEDLLDAAALLKAAKAGMTARYLFDANKKIITYDRIKADDPPPHSLDIPKVVIVKVNYRQQRGRDEEEDIPKEEEKEEEDIAKIDEELIAKMDEEVIPKIVVKNVRYKLVGWDGKENKSH